MKRGKLLLQEDIDKDEWGNLPANINFLSQTGLLESKKRILEIGCGKGKLLEILTENGHNIVGIDLDQDALRHCNTNLSFCCAEATKLPFPDDSFDVVLGMDVFEHIPETDHHIEEVNRVLVPGGYYILETPNIFFNFPFEMLRNIQRLGWRRTFAFLEPPWHCALHSFWGVKREFQRKGFSVDFLDIPVVTEWFIQKLQRFMGKTGPMLLKFFNPDKMPIPLRTNFFVVAKSSNKHHTKN